MAAFEKVSRAAAETASDEKRARLAHTIVHVGPWSSLSSALRQQFLELIVRYDDLHIAVLAYFRNPAQWLANNVRQWSPDQRMAGGPLWPLEQYLLPGDPDSLSALSSVVATLRSDGLIVLPDASRNSTEETLVKRTTSVGDGLLQFVEDGPVR